MKNQSLNSGKQKNPLSRRKFIGSAAMAGAAFTIVPRHVLGGPGYKPPSDKLNVAGIGIGNMGNKNLNFVAKNGENIVALCDVDRDYAGHVFKFFPGAKQYTDYRKMLDIQKDIDAVIIATPDHSHAVIAAMAMRMGKHVYVQKPMSRTIDEARKLTEIARENKVITQMGNQGHSGDGVRLICEWIWDGAIGPVREVYAWTNRPVWPQGIYRSQDTVRVPRTLAWDLWLGPAADRPYHPAYLPRLWRGWWDFGCGAIGDMACHVLDPVFWALKLGYPTIVEASSPQVFAGRGILKYTLKETAPVASIIRYQFPARENMPPVKLNWFDGGLLPPRPDELEPERGMGGSGVIFVGDKGKIMCGEYSNDPRIIPESKMKAYKQPAQTIPRIPLGRLGGHEADWIRACKDGKPAGSNFEYAGPMTETALLGNVAIRVEKRLDWDGMKMKAKNAPEADKFIHHQYRDGWSL